MKKLVAELKKMGRRRIAGELVHAVGRIFLFFGFLGILLALSLFCVDLFSGGGLAQIAGGSTRSGAGHQLAPILTISLTVVALIATCFCLAYMFYWMNKWTKFVVSLIARYTKSGLTMLEVSLTLMVFALGAALLSAVVPAYMSTVLACNMIGAGIGLVSFVAAHFIEPKQATTKVNA